MSVTYRYKLHNHQVLWPQHKPLSEVLHLKATTPESIWTSIYQGSATPDGGLIFLQEWWERPGSRYRLEDKVEIIGRWISADTAYKDKEQSDYTALLVGELLADYRLRIRDLVHGHFQFPELPERIESLAHKWNEDGLLRGIIIEDKGSGTSAIQTLQHHSPHTLASLIYPFLPTTSKVVRASQAAVWCKQDCILLPVPEYRTKWLIDIQAELFSFPMAEHDDITDAFSMLILHLEHILAEGYRARSGLW